METAAARLREIQRRIGKAASLAAREPGAVSLIAVSKFQPPDAIVDLIEAGQRAFGENRVQEMVEKWPAILDDNPSLDLHFVGRLQSNKAREAAALCRAIHSVDRSSLVIALASAAQAQGRSPDLFIQVNIGDEPQKGGCRTEDLPALIDVVRAESLPLIGLMCVPPVNAEPAPYYALLASLARRHGLAGLSMGMSEDFETAVMIGATHVRVGTAFFGERSASRLTQAAG